MRLNRIVIEDFGPYRGENELDLHTTSDSPVVLFGGQNGAGKTTLFKAIQFALHGKSALGRRTSEKEYKQVIASKFHEYPDKTATEASVRVEFEYAKFGNIDHYSVTRSWRDRGKSVVENLEVRRNGKLPADLERDQWQDFLKELIPPGVSQLFFFDGEKIQELATAIEEDDNFEESLYSLLGLDLVGRLDADLSIYLSNKLDESGIEGITDEIEGLREEKDGIEDEINSLEEEQEQLEDRLSELEAEIDNVENEIASEGGSYAKKRDSLKERRVELETKIDGINEEIREIATGAFPFALAPGLCRSVVDRLDEEEERQEKEAARQRLRKEMASLVADEGTFSDIEVPREEAEDVTRQIQQKIEERLDEPSEPSKLLNQFSSEQRDEMYSVVDDALNEVPQELGGLTTELESLIRERQEVETKLGRAPDESVISPLVEELNSLTEEATELKSRVGEIEGELSEKREERSRLENSLEKKLKHKSEHEGVSDRATLASNVQDVLDQYRDQLTRDKLSQLEDELTKRYLSLSNKSQFYDQIVIDENELDIKVKTIHGNHKPQSELSAGERQIFATALLWALAEISGRPLPFIVDTPMGRLDKSHRENLVQNFFPEAAHQVMVFSTDTEVDNQHYESLDDSISQSYRLEYDEQRGCTNIEEGYFWSESDTNTSVVAEGD